MQVARELKNHDTSVVADPLLTSGTFLPLCTIPQGISYVNRIGDVVRITSIKLRYSVIFGPADNVISPVHVRILIWRAIARDSANIPLYSVGAAFDAQAILDNSVVSNGIYCPYATYEHMQHKILFDEVITYNPKVTLTGAGALKPISVDVFKTIKLHVNNDVEYSPSDATGLSVNNGDVACQFIASANSAAVVTIGARTYFYDD